VDVPDVPRITLGLLSEHIKPEPPAIESDSVIVPVKPLVAFTLMVDVATILVFTVAATGLALKL
jgi:hypothetical protein